MQEYRKARLAGVVQSTCEADVSRPCFQVYDAHAVLITRVPFFHSSLG